MNDVEQVVMCGCGGILRYSHRQKDGSEKMSCNKYVVCMTWSEQQDRITELSRENTKMKAALQKIVNVNACDYEYRTWAKEGLGT